MKTRVIDVREYPEYAAGHIPGSELVPLGTLDTASKNWSLEQEFQVVCRTGRRAEQARQFLDAKGFHSVEVLRGGFELWKNAGKPVAATAYQPWSMERQVRFGAGTLVLSFVALGALASRKFLIGVGAVGVGLVYAGVSSNCIMGRVLGRMPWNQSKRAAA